MSAHGTSQGDHRANVVFNTATRLMEATQANPMEVGVDRVVQPFHATATRLYGLCYEAPEQSPWQDPENPPTTDEHVLLAVQWKESQTRSIVIGACLGGISAKDPMGTKERRWCKVGRDPDKEFDVLGWMPLPPPPKD